MIEARSRERAFSFGGSRAGMKRRSAGILLFRRTGPSLEVLIAHPGGPFWARRDAGAWSIPKGEHAEGEDPRAAAFRELEEETGLTGGEWRYVGRMWTSPGFCRELMHLFVADDVEPGDAHPDADEQVELVRWPVDEVERRIGEIEDAKTLAGLLLYLRGR